MKLPAFLFAAMILLAQPSTPPSVIYVTSDPAGSCAASAQLRFNTSNGKLWGCNALTWGQIGGSGGANPGSPDNSLQYRLTSTTFGGIPLSGYDGQAVGATVFLGNTGTNAIGTLDDCVYSGTYSGDDSHRHFYAYTSPVGNSITITAATNANPVSLTSVGHGQMTGTVVVISGATGNWTPINGTFTITVTGADTFTIPVNSTTFGALTGSPVAATPDVLNWAQCPTIGYSGCTSETVVNLTGSAQVLADGVSITCSSTIGHGDTDEWEMMAGVMFMPNIIPSSFVSWRPVPGDPPAVLTIQGTTGNPPAHLFAKIDKSPGVPGDCATWINTGLGYSPCGSTPCTFATLSTVMTANGQSCYCSNCDVTSGSDNTCKSGTGPAHVEREGGVNKCFQ